MSKTLSLGALDGALTALGRQLDRRAAQNVAEPAADYLHSRLRARAAAVRFSGDLERSLTRGQPARRRGIEAVIGFQDIAGAILEPGRRVAKKSGRVVGSTRAKSGIIKPARRDLNRKLKAIVSKGLGPVFR